MWEFLVAVLVAALLLARIDGTAYDGSSGPVLLQTVLAASTSFKSAYAANRTFFERINNSYNCPLINRGPDRTEPLTFCNFYNDNSCCTPLMDLEILNDYQQLTSLGTSCRIRDELRDQPFARVYCLSCNPNLPNFIRSEGYTPLKANCPTAPRAQTLLICKEWALKAFMVNTPLDIFDECGLDRSSGCFDSNGNRINGRNRYTCGDDKLMPSSVFLFNDDGLPWDAASAIESFLNYDDMQAPNIDGSFGFKLVSSRACVGSEFMNDNPDCLRSATEAHTYTLSKVGGNNAGCSDGDFTVKHPQICAPVHAEQCYAGSPASRPQLALLILLLCAVLFAVVLL